MRTDETDDPGEATIVETGAVRSEDDRVLAVGATVARFVILSMIGEGAVGRVYAAYDPELDRQVALKLRKGTRGPDDANEVARVRREAQALAKITHPNVVTVYDVGEHDGQLYVAMEYVAGETLRNWAKSRPSWRAVIDTYIAAGQGLLAVHEAGLVHRDVKPDNIMRSVDGRVRVMDFGLARDSIESQPPSMSDTGELHRSTTLTRTGTLSGTPAYMAPEQHLGLPIDARSDQFALCVSLWEALYVERPFVGNNLAALAFNVTHGDRRPVPADSSVPAWVRRAVERGLAVDPTQRYPSVAGLLDALGHDPAVQLRRRFAIAGVVALSVGLASWVGWLSNTRGVQAPVAPPCAEVETFDSVWDPSRSHTELADAFARSGSPLASSATEHAARGLDAWAREWNEARRDTCEATHVRHEQSPALMDARIACLDRRRARVAGIIEAFMQADVELVREAPTIVGKLEQLDACSDAARLLSVTTLPSDPKAAATIASLSLRVESLAARSDTGRTDSLLTEARALAREADATAYPPLQVDAMLLVAEAEEYELGPAASLETTRTAYFLALQENLIAQAALAAVEMLWRTSLSDPMSPTLAIWSEHARVLVHRVEPDGRLEARRLINEGIIAWNQGDLALALERTRLAVAIAERAVGPRTALVADYRNNLGYLSWLLGDEAEAQKQFEFTLSVWSETLGPEHPRLGVAKLSLAEIAIEQGRFDDARELAEHALQLHEAAGEVDGPNVAYALNVIAELDRRDGKLATARAGHEHALELTMVYSGAEHWRSAQSQAGLGEVALREGDLDAALEHFTAAARVFEPLGAYKREHGRALFGLARVEAARGHMDIAREHAARARERFVEIGRRGERDLLAIDEWLREHPLSPP